MMWCWCCMAGSDLLIIVCYLEIVSCFIPFCSSINHNEAISTQPNQGTGTFSQKEARHAYMTTITQLDYQKDY